MDNNTPQMDDKSVNFAQYLPLAFQLVSELTSAGLQFDSGQPVNVPPIRTYIGKNHVELTIGVKNLT